MTRSTIIPSELIPAAIQWERLRESFWSQLGRDTQDLRLKINGLEHRIQRESMGQG